MDADNDIQVPAGVKPPPDPNPGDIWYNSGTGHFYYRDEHDRWVATDFEDHVIDVITDKELIEDPREAYDRAMSIL